MRSGTVRELTYLALLVPGFVFFWTLLRVDAVPRAYPYLVALWISGARWSAMPSSAWRCSRTRA